MSEAGKHYGEGIIKNYSKKLTKELGKGYTFTSLTRMKKFYLLIQKLATVSQQLSWSHYRELIPLKDINKINYYINIAISQSLSRDKLRYRIKSKEYERLPEETRNKLINSKKLDLIDFAKEPILIKNNSKYEVFSEKVLQKLILEDISSFLKELGTEFTFVDNEYKIKIGNSYNYIDLLLFNIKYNCYVVIELKISNLKKEYIGQIHVYMNYIDNNLKQFNQGKTIGIIICKKNNKFIMSYCSDNRIFSKEYLLLPN